MYIGGWLEGRIGPRATALTGCAVLSAAVFAASFARSLAELALTYGLLFGVGVGLAYTMPLVCGMRWLPQRKGLINGVVTAGFGLGACVFNLIMTRYLNPDNVAPGDIQPHSEVANRVPSLLRLLAAVYGAMGCLGAAALVDPPRPERGGGGEPLLPQPSINAEPGRRRDATPGQVACNAQGGALWLLFVLTSVGGVFVIGSYKTYAITRTWGNNDVSRPVRRRRDAPL